VVTDEEILDHVHFWRYVGYILGVEPSLYPETVEDWWRMDYTTILQHTKRDGADARIARAVLRRGVWSNRAGYGKGS
jgi:hypothetical protein